MTFKIIALVIITILLVLDYAMLVVASRADERAERMYRAWKMQSIVSNSDAENAKYTFRKEENDERSDNKINK